MKKKIIASICAIILVLATVVGTIAYFTDSDSALNTFTVGKVGITFDETDTDNDDNTQDNVTVETVVRDKANEYHLIPGSTYEKDPTIHVDNKTLAEYENAKITIDAYAIQAAGFEEFTAEQIWAKF